MKTFLLYLSLGIFLVLSSCDKIEPPFEKTVVDTTDVSGAILYPDTSFDNQRRVLVEDYTGHTCGFCPEAGKTLDTLINLFGPRVVPIAVHAGNFAVPQPPTYPTDFRNANSTELDNTFGNSSAGNPNGMVNRKGFPGGHILQYPTWNTAVSNALSQPPAAFLNIINRYSPTDRKVNTQIRINLQQSIAQDLALAIYLIEDSIVADQKDYSQANSHVTNYVHKHVLRTAFNGTFGEVVATNPVAAGAVVGRKYTITLDPSWRPEHCSVVAILFRKDNYEVIQASDRKIYKKP